MNVLSCLYDLPGEIWKEIPEYKGNYLVSNYSRVKSLIGRKPIILKKGIASGKYKVVLVNKKGKRVTESCGRLCARVFIRPPKENEVLKYLDNNQKNDHVSNLRWISRKECANNALKKQNYSNKGESNGMSKLNRLKVEEIRAMKATGVPNKTISNEFRISMANVTAIIQRRTWNFT